MVFRWGAGGPSFVHGNPTPVDLLLSKLIKRYDRSDPNLGVEIRVKSMFAYAYECISPPKLNQLPWASDPSLVWFLFQYPIVVRGDTGNAIGDYYLTLFDHLGVLWEDDLHDSVRDSLASSIAPAFAFLPLLFTEHFTTMAATSAARWTEHHLLCSGALLDSRDSPRLLPGGATKIRVGVVVRNAEPRTETFIATSFAALPKDEFETVLVSFAEIESNPYSSIVQSRFDRVEIINTDVVA